MSHILYTEGEENDKEETIDNYKYLFSEYEIKLPNLSEALNQMFISSGAEINKSHDLIKDILDKCKATIDNNWNEIKKKYDKINKDDAYIICSYTCEAKDKEYNPYKILNENLVSENRKKGINNISKYLYIFLRALRKLEIYIPKKPEKYLYRCLKKDVITINKPNDKKWIPYMEGNIKTFWGFTSTSPNKNMSFDFLEGKDFKSGTIFSLGGYIWGYDISLFNKYDEEEILLEPERKYEIDNIYSINNITHITCNILKTDIVLDKNYINTINNIIEKEKGLNNNEINNKKLIKPKNINEINITIKIEEKDINKDIYFLNYDKDEYLIKNNEDYRDSVDYYSKLLNESKIEILINNIKYENKRYFKPEKTGIYNIKLIFKNIINNCQFMFHQCPDLTSIDLSSFDTRNVTNMQCMFHRCYNLISIDLSSFDTRNVTNMQCLFGCCKNLTSIDLSSLDTKNVTNMGSMFFACHKLKSIDLSSFNTKNVTDMRSMFYQCKFTSIDLSSFDTKNITNMNNMFAWCSLLKTIKISKDISNTKLKEEISHYKNINIIE